MTPVERRGWRTLWAEPSVLEDGPMQRVRVTRPSFTSIGLFLMLGLLVNCGSSAAQSAAPAPSPAAGLAEVPPSPGPAAPPSPVAAPPPAATLKVGLLYVFLDAGVFI